MHRGDEARFSFRFGKPDSKPTTVASAGAESDCGHSDFSPPANTNRTVVSDSTDFPWLVSIYAGTFNKSSCSGTVVNDRWILAVGWCLGDSVRALEATFAAVLDVATGKPIINFDIVRLELFPEFGPLPDLALLKTSEPMQVVRPICLPDKQVHQVKIGATMSMTSWENFQPANGSRGLLKWHKMIVVDTPCNTDYVPNPAFCVEFERITDASGCNFLNDQGAPVMAKETVDGVTRWYLVSMQNTLSIECAIRFPLIQPFAVNMVDNMEWIRSVIAKK